MALECSHEKCSAGRVVLHVIDAIVQTEFIHSGVFTDVSLAVNAKIVWNLQPYSGATRKMSMFHQLCT